MRSRRPGKMMVLLGLWLGGFSACTSVLVGTPISKKSETWDITLGHVKQGPDEYVGDITTVVAGPDEDLIWTILTVKNVGNSPQMFSYESCMLEAGELSRRPLVVDRNEPEIKTAADRVEGFNPGQQRTRELVYSFPEKLRPAHMKCDTIVFPIPAAR
jgi:hypothetical protein